MLFCIRIKRFSFHDICVDFPAASIVRLILRRTVELLKQRSVGTQVLVTTSCKIFNAQYIWLDDEK